MIPSYRFVPDRINFPVPLFVKLAAAPLITPEIVKVPLTVIDASAGKTNGHKMVAVPEISVIATPLTPIIVKLFGPEMDPPGISVMDRQFPFTFMETITPALIVISSPIPGNPIPPQVAGSFQFPFWMAVKEAPLTIFPIERSKKNNPIRR